MHISYGLEIRIADGAVIVVVYNQLLMVMINNDGACALWAIRQDDGVQVLSFTPLADSAHIL